MFTRHWFWFKDAEERSGTTTVPDRSLWKRWHGAALRFMGFTRRTLAVEEAYCKGRRFPMWNACYGVIFKHYADFEGRARRSEFWWFYLAYMIAIVTLSILGEVHPVFGIAYWGLVVLLFLPGLSVAVRRLHDSGKSGWWFLIVLIPLAGWIVFLVFMILPSDVGTNRYGR